VTPTHAVVNALTSRLLSQTMQVQILWVVSQPQPTWEKRLPSNVAAIINAARRLNPPTDNSRITGGIQTAGEMILSLISNIVSKAGEGSWLGECCAVCSVLCAVLCRAVLCCAVLCRAVLCRACGSSVRLVRLEWCLALQSCTNSFCRMPLAGSA
jgi:hypothetical protein